MALSLNNTYQSANLTQTSYTLGGYGAIPNSNITLNLNGSNGSNYSDFSISASPYSSSSGLVKLSGENADIDINGVSLKRTLEGIQQRLALLEPNPALEKEWAELKRLGDEYRALEQEIKDRMKTWDILKKE